MSNIQYADKNKNIKNGIANAWRDIDANEVKNVVNGKLDKSQFLVYTASTKLIAGSNITLSPSLTGITISSTGGGGGSSPITGVTNGISLLGKNVALGGILTGETVIGQLNGGGFFYDKTGAHWGQNSFGSFAGDLQSQSGYSLNYSGTFNNPNNYFEAGSYAQTQVTGRTSYSGFFNSSLDNAQGNANGLFQIFTGNGNKYIHFEMKNDNNANNDYCRVSGVNFQFKGLEYAADYSPNFINRSIPDVAWVTGLTSSLSSPITGVTNGLSLIDKNVVLGGHLTGRTIVGNVKTGGFLVDNPNSDNGNNYWGKNSFGSFSGDLTNPQTGYSLTYASNYGNTNYFEGGVNSQIQVSGVSSSAYMYGAAFDNGGGNVVGQIGLYTSSNGRNFGITLNSDTTPENSSIKINGDVNTFRGVEYQTDYSANFNGRSLVDANFVTGITSNIASTIVLPVTGATNGLSMSGKKIILGGITTGATLTSAISPTFKDNTFNVGSGFTTFLGGNLVFASAQQADGKILLGGPFTGYTGLASNSLIRINTDGSKDTSFDIGIGFEAFASVNSIAIQNDGKILVGGAFNTYTGSTNNYLIRLNTDGSKDSTFNIDSGFNGVVDTVAIQSNGKILVGGRFTQFTGSTANKIIRLNANGTKDSTFNIGSGFNDEVLRIKVQTDGKILVGGWFTQFTGSTNNRLIRLNSNGTKDSTFNIGSGFGGGIVGWVSAIQIQPDGKIIAAGDFNTFTGSSNNNIIRLNANGSNDTTFNAGSGFGSIVNDLALQSDGKVFVAGQYTTFNGSTQNRLIRLNADGSKDTSFDIGSGFSQIVYTITLPSDNNEIFVGGQFVTYNGLSSKGLVKLAINQHETILLDNVVLNYNGINPVSYTPRTLVDVAFVTGITSQIQPKYKSYVALVTQSGSNAPSITVLENNLGENIVWTRSSTGQYRGTKSSVFTPNKTYCSVGSFTSGLNVELKTTDFGGGNVQLALITTFIASSFSDDLLLNTSIEIRVYP